MCCCVESLCLEVLHYDVCAAPLIRCPLFIIRCQQSVEVQNFGALILNSKITRAWYVRVSLWSVLRYAVAQQNNILFSPLTFIPPLPSLSPPPPPLPSHPSHSSLPGQSCQPASMTLSAWSCSSPLPASPPPPLLAWCSCSCAERSSALPSTQCQTCGPTVSSAAYTVYEGSQRARLYVFRAVETLLYTV